MCVAVYIEIHQADEFRCIRLILLWTESAKIWNTRQYKRRLYISLLSLLPPAAGQNPRRHPRGPRVLGTKITPWQKKYRFFKNRARKGLPKSTQGIAETSLGVEFINQSATVVTRGYKSCDLSGENVPCEIRLNGCVGGKVTCDLRVVKSLSRLTRTIERVSSRSQRD